MISVEVRASRELALVSRELKAAGDRGLQRELRRGLRNGAKPVAKAGRDAAREGLPHEGGLNDWIADGATFSVRTNIAAAHPTVRIVVGRKGHDLKSIDEGVLRHPVYGHRDRWVTQQVRPHVITEGMEHAAPEARAELVKALDEWARRLT